MMLKSLVVGYGFEGEELKLVFGDEGVTGGIATWKIEGRKCYGRPFNRFVGRLVPRNNVTGHRSRM
jgi:hypothetical protein